ncbi:MULTISPECIES: hypothetical protein [Mixta]|uniref:hypothetical protein n=1 Tax=Mixta TaxID=2100764 RepID=UPI0005360FDC|nr:MULTISPECIES: hypothetical protein [Mixta]AIX72993.1 hypothetical protein PSNIH2_03875 [Pantoea sp. PSNIH2]MCR1566774.1 hypothetical protein [Mixta sp.]MDU4291460.1 hypothetical protein [Mixta calida]MDU5770047.1 hypothetical protein [Mixta calida]MDU5828332.1 hypothetical protein [Mixta calida]
MLTHYFIIAAVLLAALLLSLWRLFRQKRLAGRTVLLLSLFGALALGGALGLYRYVILPERLLQARIDAAQQQMRRLPGYRIVQQQEPALWRQLNAELATEIRAGASPSQATGASRAMLADLLNQRIGHAGDEAINHYISVSLRQMESLRARDVQLCFRFLFPQVGGGVNLNDALPESLVQDDLNGIEQLLRDSVGPERPVDLRAAHQHLNDVVQQLYLKWGSDLQWLNAPADAHVNRQKMCDMTIDLYRAILALPHKQSANILRMMLSANAG